MTRAATPRAGEEGGRLRLAGQLLWARLRPQEKSEKTAYLFLLPYLLFFIAFGFIPVFLGFFVSLTDWSVVGDFQWLGLRNYIKWLGDDHLAKVTLNTLRYTLLSVPSVAAVSLALALYVNKKLVGYVFSRIAFFAPYVVAVTVTSLLWKWILETDFGVLNYYLMQLGIPAIPWLSTVRWAMVALVITKLWWDAGFSMVIFLAGLQDIPADLYEAARIDGANGLAPVQVHHVSTSTGRFTSLVITLNLIMCMQTFSTMFLMTEGGPAGSTTTVVYEIYQQSFAQFKMGYGSALSFLLFCGYPCYDPSVVQAIPGARGCGLAAKGPDDHSNLG